MKTLKLESLKSSKFIIEPHEQEAIAGGGDFSIEYKNTSVLGDDGVVSHKADIRYYDYCIDV